MANHLQTPLPFSQRSDEVSFLINVISRASFLWDSCQLGGSSLNWAYQGLKCSIKHTYFNDIRSNKY